MNKFLTNSALLGWFLLGGGLIFGETPELNHPVFKQPLQGAGEGTAFSDVAKELQKIGLLRAEFNQEKKIKALRRPLRSKGRFIFDTQKGLYWHTKTPFDSVFVITPKGITQLTDGEKTASVKVEDQPIIHGFTQVFMAMFTGDASVLKQKFDLYFEGDATHWTLGLVPKGRIMASMIHHIVLQGDQSVHDVNFVEKNGDFTHLVFSDVITNGSELTREESLYFETQ